MSVVVLSVCHVFLFFFKQKTAYEMRISDWSSDVCSSDLPASSPMPAIAVTTPPRAKAQDLHLRTEARRHPDHQARAQTTIRRRAQIGRASCRERVCQYV